MGEVHLGASYIECKGKGKCSAHMKEYGEAVLKSDRISSLQVWNESRREPPESEVDTSDNISPVGTESANGSEQDVPPPDVFHENDWMFGDRYTELSRLSRLIRK